MDGRKGDRKVCEPAGSLDRRKSSAEAQRDPLKLERTEGGETKVGIKEESRENNRGSE